MIAFPTVACRLSAWSAIQISPEFKISERIVAAQHQITPRRRAENARNGL
jgi:hypothetical protein